MTSEVSAVPGVDLSAAPRAGSYAPLEDDERELPNGVQDVQSADLDSGGSDTPVGER